MTDLIPAKRLVRAKRVAPPSPVLNLHDYHHRFIRSSGGKDSQAMLDYVVSIADVQREVNEMIAEGREFEPVEDWVM